MEIKVNKSAAAKRKQEVIDEILAKAKEAAERGENNFIYHFKEGERASFPPPLINISVKNASNGTVECGYRSDHGSWVKYFIVEPKK